MKAGRVWYVGAGPGDPELISLLGQRLLREAALVVHDRGIAPEVLAECRSSAEIEEARVSERVEQAELAAIASRIADAAHAGQDVVRLKLGDPLFFSRALEEIAVLTQRGIDVRVVPGITSPLAAAAFAGAPLTAESGVGAVVLVCTLHLQQVHAVRELIQRQVSTAESLGVLCSSSQVPIVLRALLDIPRLARARAAIVSSATTPEQQVIEGELEYLLDRFSAHPLHEPLLLLLGAGVARRPQLAWYEHLPLFGRRLLLCRPRHQAERSAIAMRARGARPVIMPLIEIEPPTDGTALEECVHRLSSYDWVILTSANGAERLMAALAAARLDARAFGRAKIAVIGPGTARPLARWGIIPDLVAQEHVAEALGRELLDVGAGNSALLVRAEVARDVLPNSLREAGLGVSVVAAYSTRKLGPDRSAQLREMIESASIDAVLLTSSSMAESLASALGPSAPEVLACTCVASIGPITTGSLKKLGIGVNVTATEYTVEGLLDALERHFAPMHASASADTRC